MAFTLFTLLQVVSLEEGIQRKFLIGVRVQDQYFIGVGVLSQNFRTSFVLWDPYFIPPLLQ